MSPEPPCDPDPADKPPLLLAYAPSAPSPRRGLVLLGLLRRVVLGVGVGLMAGGGTDILKSWLAVYGDGPV